MLVFFNRGNTWCLILLFLITFFLNTTVHAGSVDILLIDYEAEYRIAWMGVPVASSVHQLKSMQKGLFLFTAEAKPFLTLLPYEYYESALFKSANNTIIPMEYIYDHQEGRKHKQGKLLFNRSKMRVTDTIPKQPWEALIQKNTQDKYTHTLLLRRDLLAGKTPLSYSVVDGHEIKEYVYEIIGTESLKTSIGTLNTVKLQLISGNRTTHLWMAKDLNYLLIKLTQYKNGSKILSGDIQRYQPSKLLCPGC